MRLYEIQTIIYNIINTHILLNILTLVWLTACLNVVKGFSIISYVTEANFTLAKASA